MHEGSGVIDQQALQKTAYCATASDPARRQPVQQCFSTNKNSACHALQHLSLLVLPHFLAKDRPCHVIQSNVNVFGLPA